MRIVTLDHRPRSGRVHGAANASSTWKERHSLLVVLVDDGGNVGIGEASPLPGFSPDDLAAARAAVARWAARLPIEIDGDDPLARVAACLVDVAAPSARCALETALLDLVGQRRAAPLWSLLGGVAPATVAIAGLITADEPDAAAERARDLVSRGIETAKVKIGRPGRLDAEIATAEAVREAGIDRLRLDANGCLSPESLESDLGALERLAPELIEEPAAPERIARLDRWPRSLPLGFDETLQRADARDLVDRFAATGRLAALVLKPMVLGGALPALRLADHAASLGLGCVASHLFDGPIAWQAAAHLALALPGPRWAAGLDTHAGLRAWPAAARPLSAGSAIEPDDRPGLGLRMEDVT